MKICGSKVPKYLAVKRSARQTDTSSDVDTFPARLKKVLDNDPKPIFDHFRNIGIVAVIIYGATFIQSTYYKTTINDNDNIFINLWIFVLSATGLVLITINISHAKRSIATVLFGKEHANDVLGNVYTSFFKAIKPMLNCQEITKESSFRLVRYATFQVVINIYWLLTLFVGFTPMIEKRKAYKKNREEITQLTSNLAKTTGKVDRLVEEFEKANANSLLRRPTQRVQRTNR